LRSVNLPTHNCCCNVAMSDEGCSTTSLGGAATSSASPSNPPLPPSAVGFVAVNTRNPAPFTNAPLGAGAVAPLAPAPPDTVAASSAAGTAAAAMLSPFSFNLNPLSSASNGGVPFPMCRPSTDDFVPFLNPVSLGTIAAAVAVALEPNPDDDIVQVRDKRKGPRAQHVARAPQQRGDTSKSQMADMLDTNAHLDPSSRHGKSFRPVYRIPGTMFEDVHRWIDENREEYGFQKNDFDCCGQPAIPLKLKLMASFFKLSTGLLDKGMASQIGCDEETMRRFFLRFIRTVSTVQGPKWIKLPSTLEQLQAHVETYDIPGGLPGCMGSIDCTHIGYCRARTSVKSWYAGFFCAFSVAGCR